MSDDTDTSRPTIDRRSVLISAGTTLTGLGTLASLQTAAAQGDREWPLGGSREEHGRSEGEHEQDRAHADGEQGYEQQQTVTDDTGAIDVTIPAAWSDVDTTPVSIGPSIWAAPDLEAFSERWDVPGIEVYVTTDLGSDLEEALDRYLEELAFDEQCADAGQRLFRTAEYAFRSQLLSQCGDSETAFLAMAGVPLDESVDGNTTADQQMRENETPRRNATPGGGPGPGFPGGTQSEISEDELPSDAPYVILFGAQIVAERDVRAVITALNSLEAQAPGTESA
mgnify:FL=1